MTQNNQDETQITIKRHKITTRTHMLTKKYTKIPQIDTNQPQRLTK